MTKMSEQHAMPQFTSEDVIEELTRTALGRHLLHHAIMIDDVRAVIRKAKDVEEETKEQVLAGLDHIADPGEAVSYFAFCVHMAELRGGIPDRDGFDTILKAIGDAGERMPIIEPSTTVH